MATTRITELDFDSIKSNLKSFLSDTGNDLFGSYNFEGSIMSSLLDVLAYNTHYMAYYVNMLSSEMFLDSATDRSSVSSIAKHLGYTPKSPTCASITLRVSDESMSNFTIPEKTLIRDTGQSFSFYTLDSFTTVNGEVDIICYEGQLVEIDYVVNTDGLSNRYLLREGADTSTLKVTVRDSYSDNLALEFNNFSDISELTSDSAVYFLNEVENEQYEIVFGDGVFSKALSNGNVIQLRYLVSSYDSVNDIDPNGIGIIGEEQEFELASGINGLDPSIETLSPSSGAKSIESIESVKFMAPKSFQSQNRTVTAVDYKNFVLSNFSNARSVLTWGGEDNDAPAYGKVFIAVRPTSGYYLTESDRSVLVNDVLSKNKIVGITPEIIDPDYTHMKINSDVKYDSANALQPPGSMSDTIVTTISNFVTVNLDEFGGSFRASQLSGDIDDTNSAVLSNYTTTTLYKSITPASGSTMNTDEFKFNSSFVNLTSDLFKIEGRSYEVKFSNNGNLLTLVDIDGITVIDYIGDITSNGIIKLAGIDITSTDDINLYLITDQVDIVPLRNQILTVKDEDITVNMIRG